MPQRGRRIATAGTATFAGAAVIAVLEIVQRSLGAFHLRSEVQIGSGLTVALATWFAARLRARASDAAQHDARRAHLRSLLRVPGRTRVRDADPLELGVFPPRRRDGLVAVTRGLPAYAEREVDADLRAALVPGAIVVVLGPPRAGATRTAYEAACRALGDARVVAPRSAQGLEGLLDLDPPLALGYPRALIWLDGLDEQLLAVLGRRGLEPLGDLAAEVVVLSTVRQGEWDGGLGGEGEAARGARALLGSGHLILLDARLTDDEARTAVALHPGAQLCGGIGAALSSDGREGGVPHHARPDDADEANLPPPRWHRDGALLAAGVATLAVVLATCWSVVRDGFEPASVADQLVAVKREARANGYTVSQLSEVSLRGADERTYVELLRDRARERSDVLEIYDVRGDDLERKLRFASSKLHGEFQYRVTADVDQNGTLDVVGGLSQGTRVHRNALVPVAVSYDEASDRYRIEGLDLGEPKLLRDPATVRERQYQEIYDELWRFRDADGRVVVEGHPVQDIYVTAKPYRLIAGWFMTPPLAPGDIATYDVYSWIFDTTGDRPRVRGCTLTPGRERVVVREAYGDRLTQNVLRDAYAEVTRTRPCTPLQAERTWAPGVLGSRRPPKLVELMPRTPRAALARTPAADHID